MPRQDELARLCQLQVHCEADFRALAAQYPELCTAVAQRRLDGYICQQNAAKGECMPSKGYRTMGEELENVAMRLPMSVLAQVDAHIDTLRQEAPWAKVGRSDALRDLVVRGLASVTRRPTRQATPTPPQPALPLAPPPPPPPIGPQPPLALEPAPASEVRPACTTKTPSSRRKDGKGGNPGLSPEKLQQIAETAAQHDKLSYAELSKLLFDRGIHHSTDSTTGAAKPVNPGTLKKWLDRAREQGLL